MDNMLIIRDNNDSFEALAYMDPVTNSCQAKTMFIDKVQYSIIDTPKFFNSQTPTEQIQKHIIDYFL
ncbi:hypothetical protein RhiirC2_789443 [Rhizophagus irregularis]|uniref:AIG1-type G domain-containing protein n=1 Tax=Rhizophagus irregularis TaxID=588596 RepID=A0A2N1MN70_9GLOM|nr:hypothetical protein RhiirC2_789443 [Rhizophagus irregularis]